MNDHIEFENDVTETQPSFKNLRRKQIDIP